MDGRTHGRTLSQTIRIQNPRSGGPVPKPHSPKPEATSESLILPKNATSPSSADNTPGGYASNNPILAEAARSGSRTASRGRSVGFHTHISVDKCPSTHVSPIVFSRKSDAVSLSVLGAAPHKALVPRSSHPTDLMGPLLSSRRTVVVATPRAELPIRSPNSAIGCWRGRKRVRTHSFATDGRTKSMGSIEASASGGAGWRSLRDLSIRVWQSVGTA